MTIKLELLNHMAANHPDAVALAEGKRRLTFTQLKRLVDTLSPDLFGKPASIYGQHSESETNRTVVALCADQAHIHTLINIPCATSKEGLSAIIKAAHLQVIFTDVMNKLWETANIFGPFISMVKPIELHDRKIWKVQFRSEHSGAQIDEEELQGRWEWEALQPTKPHSNR